MPATTAPLRLDPSALHTLGQGVALLVGSADASREPEVCRAWGPRWSPDSGQLSVVLALPAGERTLSNLDANPAISLTFCVPTDYKAFQLKGQLVDRRAPGAGDWHRARAHFDTFLSAMPQVGLQPSTFSNWFPAQGLMLVCAIDQMFSQAPGPRAGEAL